MSRNPYYSQSEWNKMLERQKQDLKRENAAELERSKRHYEAMAIAKLEREEREKERMKELEREREESEREREERERKSEERESEREEDGLKSIYKVVVLENDTEHENINFLLDKGYIPIGGLTEGPSGTSRQVMYRKAFKTPTTNSDTALIDLSDPPTTPIQETLEGVFNTSGGKRKNKKSKKYISKRKNKTKKRNFNY